MSGTAWFLVLILLLAVDFVIAWISGAREYPPLLVTMRNRGCFPSRAVGEDANAGRRKERRILVFVVLAVFSLAALGMVKLRLTPESFWGTL